MKKSAFRALTQTTLLFAVGLTCIPALSQEIAPASGQAVHIVRPGDTLRGLAGLYLGNQERWSELAALNPEVANPNSLYLGQRLRVPTEGKVPARAAQVTAKARSVEALPAPNPWDDAYVGDLLAERDGLRTHARSSAKLVFGDGESLLVTEDSLIYLELASSKARNAGSRDSIEVVVGQADLVGQGLGSNRNQEIELVVGDAVARPSASPEGNIQTRVRRAEAGASQMMVYEGASKVSAAGAQVDLTKGTGTTVEKGKAPAPPEKLLEAPRLLEPAAGADLDFSNPVIAWVTPPGAESTSFELCSDPECSRLVFRRANLEGDRWTPTEALPVGSYYWRLTSQAASGLDGYPTAARSLNITGPDLDLEPPTVNLSLAGRYMSYANHLVLGPSGEWKLEVEDSQSGAGVPRLVMNGELVDPGRLADAGDGDYQVSVEASDRAGNRAAPLEIAFRRDRTPPTISWEAGRDELLLRFGHSAKERRLGRKKADRTGPAVEWSGDGRRWLPLRFTEVPGWSAYVLADEPQIFLRFRDRQLATPEGEAINTQDYVRFFVQDEGSGVDRLRLRLDASGQLIAEAEDGVGNAARLEWRLISHSSR